MEVNRIAQHKIVVRSDSDPVCLLETSHTIWLVVPIIIFHRRWVQHQNFELCLADAHKNSISPNHPLLLLLHKRYALFLLPKHDCISHDFCDQNYDI